jgi:23S rRNA (uracil1939-C5)-methyltransferase
VKQRRRRAKLGSPETVTVERIDSGGEGLVSLAAGPAHVAGVIGGEQVRVRADGKRRAQLEQVLTPSADRVTPACEVASECGGCDWMHVARDARLQLYRDRVERLLSLAGLSLDGLELGALTVHPAPAELGYRTRARLHIAAHGSGAARVGYRPPRSHRLLALHACPVLSPALTPMLAELSDVLAASRGEGDALVALGPRASSAVERTRVVELAWRGELAGESLAALSRLVEAGRWAGARVWLDGSKQPASFGDPRAAVPDVEGRDLWIAPGGFAQASEEGGVALARRAAQLVQEREVGDLVELFAGSGTLSVALAPLAARFFAVEQSEEACAQLRENLAVRDLTGRVTCADANAHVVPPATATVVLDPPRVGAAGACQAIARARPQQVIYVSCNPATLVRDLGTLTAARMRLAALELFDLFPNTSHVEAIARLERS